MAIILDAFVGKCVERIADFVEEEASLVLGVKDDLEKLLRRMRKIQIVLKDAESRRIQDAAVNEWLNYLRGVMLDAEDMLDLCRFTRPRLLEDEPSNSSPSTSLVRSYFPLPSGFTSVPFRLEIGTSIKNLNDRLEEIYNDKLMFTLKPSRPDDIIRLGGVNPRDTSPLEEEDVVGSDIKEATNRLVEVIVKEQKQKCPVFAIVGMGGIGKTTLAQKLYNDPRIQNSFQVLAWVCVSQSFSETDLLEEIIRSAGGHPGSAKTKAVLVPMLKNLVMGKRLFLVLDDVWRADVWVDLLRNPMQRGSGCSRILVTTRNEDVARMMGVVYFHRVDELPVESGWELLCKRAFISGEEEEIESLKDIGIRILNNCHGLPLAIKMIAGVLSAKDRTREEWEKVFRSYAWSMSKLPEELRGALYLSYEDLPSHLKQCFLYLSLFPEDYEYKMSEIVPLWIAEGLVETHENSLEDTAKEYYTELIRRSLLHPLKSMVRKIDPLYFDQPICKMHDLLRSLACFLSENECFCSDEEGITRTSIASQLLRLSVTRDRAALNVGSIIRHKHLRTLLDFGSRTVFENDLIRGIPHLRVLYINCYGRNCILDSIGDLIYLRYLNLNGIGVSELPESLGSLRNLQSLILSNSNTLHCLPDSIGDLIYLRCLDLNNSDVSYLPESFGRLANLLILDISYCHSLNNIPEGITRLCNLRLLSMDGTPLRHVPKGIGKLQQLNHLGGVVLGDDNSIAGMPQQGCDLDDLRNLSQLRYLSIKRLERASTGMCPALQSKSYLKCLSINCFGGGEQPYTEEQMGQGIKLEEIFNELVPPACLKSLRVNGFFGCSYPCWMSGTFLEHLSHIMIGNFVSCPQVPPLGELPHLREIYIYGLSAVVTIGHEFKGAGVREGIHGVELTSIAFPKLETLNFVNMHNWEEWSLAAGETEEEPAAGLEGRIENQSLMLFPRLHELRIHKCPNLRALPKGLEQATALQKLHISNAHRLSSVEDLPSLSYLYLSENNSLERISGLTALKSLTIYSCRALKDVGSLDALRELTLPDHGLERLPEWLIQLLLHNEDSNFRLLLNCNRELLHKCLEGGPYWHIIQQIPQVHLKTLDGVRFRLYTKDPSGNITCSD